MQEMHYVVRLTPDAAISRGVPISVSSQGTSLRHFSSRASDWGLGVQTLVQPFTNGSSGELLRAAFRETLSKEFTADLAFMINQIRRGELTPSLGIRDLLGRAIQDLDSRRSEDIYRWAQRLANDVAQAGD